MPPLGGSRRNIAMTFGVEKIEWSGYLMVKKNLKILVFTESTNVMDTWTEDTAFDIGRACIASHSKYGL